MFMGKKCLWDWHLIGEFALRVRILFVYGITVVKVDIFY